MRSLAVAVVAAVLLLVSAVCAAQINVEINGRDYYGTIYTDNGEIYVALDVVGPLLSGPQFHLDKYEVTLRRATFTWQAAGASAPQRSELFGCFQRGTAVYAPLKPLMNLMGGSYAASTDGIRVAYPPASALAPRPSPTPAVVPTPSPTVRPTPSPIVVATPNPSPTPQASPSPVAVTSPAAWTPEVAMAEVRAANQAAMGNAGLIKRLEIYHPVSPDPSDVIPRTDLAGLKVYLSRLVPADALTVAMWNGRSAEGQPAYRRRLTGFRGQELEDHAVFVRLPLDLDAGWHTLRVQVNDKEAVDYRFVTY